MAQSPAGNNAFLEPLTRELILVAAAQNAAQGDAAALQQFQSLSMQLGVPAAASHPQQVLHTLQMNMSTATGVAAPACMT